MLKAASKMLPVRDAIFQVTGQEISAVSAWRYCTVGQSGIRLRYWMLGGKKLTTTEEVIEWMDSVTSHREGAPVAKPANDLKRLNAVDVALDEELA
jgi:hypothetical protein